MSNIYVTPLASPSFERLSGEATPEICSQNEELAKKGDFKLELHNREDENANKLSDDTYKNGDDLSLLGAHSSGTQDKINSADCLQGETKDVQGYAHNAKSSEVDLENVCSDVEQEKTTGDDVTTPKRTKTSLEILSPDSQTSGSRISPAYCFHSFTYGVGGSRESLDDGEKEAGPLSTSSSWEEESFDADSPFVECTRTVVDLEESGSPTILRDWDSGTEECISHDSVSFKGTSRPGTEAFQSEIYVNLHNTATDSPRNEAVMINGKAVIAVKQDNENLQGLSNGEDNTNERPSPEGAERCEVVNMSSGSHGNKGYRLVPGRGFVTEVRGVPPNGTPSGVLGNSNYWIWEDVFEGKDVKDGDYEPMEKDHVPLLWPGKAQMRYTSEVGLEETEEIVPVTCFSCFRCVIL